MSKENKKDVVWIDIVAGRIKDIFYLPISLTEYSSKRWLRFLGIAACPVWTVLFVVMGVILALPIMLICFIQMAWVDSK